MSNRGVVFLDASAGKPCPAFDVTCAFRLRSVVLGGTTTASSGCLARRIGRQTAPTQSILNCAECGSPAHAGSKVLTLSGATGAGRLFCSRKHESLSSKQSSGTRASQSHGRRPGTPSTTVIFSKKGPRMSPHLVSCAASISGPPSAAACRHRNSARDSVSGLLLGGGGGRAAAGPSVLRGPPGQLQ